MAIILAHNGVMPKIDPSAYIADNAVIIGDVVIGAEASIWFNCVLRGDVNAIRVGARSNIQDGSVVHCDGDYDGNGGFPTLIGADVLVGHMCLLHGCVLENGAFCGMGAMAMNGSRIGAQAMLGAGAQLTPHKHIAPRQLWLGRPAKYMRDLSETELVLNHDGVRHYVEQGKIYKAAQE
jgi:gamma-carbonic anhydrase